MTTEFIFVRHGETIGDAESRLHGRTDLPLSERGLRQAEDVAAHLSTWPEIHRLYASPLQRAATTAEVIGLRLALAPRVRDDLQEMDFGDFEGYAVADLQREAPELIAQMMDGTAGDAAFPNGESRRGFYQRVVRAIDDLRATEAGKRVVIVYHGGVISSALAHLLTGNPHDWQRYVVMNCSMSHVEVPASGSPVLRCWNDTAHLTFPPRRLW